LSPGEQKRERSRLGANGRNTLRSQRWLGHRSITGAAVYTALGPHRFKDFWRD
jgi:hypothetical protein